MITVFAELKAAAGKEEELRQALQEIIPLTRAESGCIAYRICQVADNPCIFKAFEVFENQEAFDSHLSSAHFIKLQTQAAELLCAEPIIEVCEEIA